jgi:cytochrome P450
MGSLTFSKNLGGLNDDEVTHDWIASQFDSTLWGVIPALFKRAPMLKYIYSSCLPEDAITKRLTHQRRVRDLVEERIQTHLLETPTKPCERDLLDTMILDPLITEDRLVSQCMLLLAAGTGNIQSTLSSTTYYLLTNPGTLRRLQSEVRSSFEDSSEISDKSATRLHYLHAVLQEALRLFPPIPSPLPRTSPGAFIDGTYVPAGCTVASATYSMSRDPRYWKDPSGFHPERWLRGDGHADLAYSTDRRQAAIPWSLGPRACIGTNMSYLVMRIILAKVIYDFDLKLLDESIRWEENLKILFLWRKPPLRVQFIPVTRTKGRSS